MPKNLTIGNEIFEFPLSGENSGWGSEVTDWAEAVTDAISIVQKPNDILLTTSSISNSATVFTSIPGFSFSTAEVIAVECRYLVTRTTTGPNAVYSEVGYIEGYFDGSDWGYSIRATGDAKILLQILPSGQVQYKVVSVAGATHVGTIVFEGRVINND
jgi:hypothetical protein